MPRLPRVIVESKTKTGTDIMSPLHIFPITDLAISSCVEVASASLVWSAALQSLPSFLRKGNADRLMKIFLDFMSQATRDLSHNLIEKPIARCLNN